MIPHDELHVVYGTGPVGLAVMRELHKSPSCWYSNPIGRVESRRSLSVQAFGARE